MDRVNQIVVKTFDNVVLLLLLLSLEQLAKIDRNLQEELMFCAQPNPLVQSGITCLQ